MTPYLNVLSNLTALLSRPANACASVLCAALLCTACVSKPAPPEWQVNGLAALQGFSSAYLRGNTRLANFEYQRAYTEITSTGRADLLARVALTRCAVRVASLEFDNCAAYQQLAQDAHAAEQAYAAFLTGHWTRLEPARLPGHHRALVLAAGSTPAKPEPVLPAPRSGMLDPIEDPLARLVAAGVLLQRGRLSAADIETATETASSQGWRRPLLAWLGVQLKHSTETGDDEAVARLQRRIDLVLQAFPKNP